MRILVVEDQENIASFVKKGLEEQGMRVDCVMDGDEGYDLACNEAYDAIVLDIMLPGRDGLSIVSNLRKQENKVPVILLTARSEVDERIQGLNAGADDYIPKPFHMSELIARLNAVTRRGSSQQNTLLQIDDLVVDRLNRQTTRDGNPIELTSREFELLSYMMRSVGRVLTRTQICEEVWNYHFDPQTNLVDVYIRRLRQKIDGDHDNKLIQTVRGVGYKMVDPAAASDS